MADSGEVAPPPIGVNITAAARVLDFPWRDRGHGMTEHTEPHTISLVALADRFIEDHKRMPNRAFAFVLGAGASRASGIKAAGQMVDDWIRALYREATGDAEGDGKAWATAVALGISAYAKDDPAGCYSELYHRMYARDPDRGYAYLEEQMRDAEPSYGYSVLARIMEDTQHKVVVTTNFDNLVADALSIFGKTYPLVCGHESLAGFISPRVRRPLVVKVHRDLLLAPKSAPEELGDLPDSFRTALTQLFGHYTPIVIGYGGNDGSLMGLLKALPPRSVPGGVYWCYWKGGRLPPSEIRQFVAAQNGYLVPIPGFDETMMLLSEALGYDVPDEFLRKRAEARAIRIGEQVLALKAKLAAEQRRLPQVSPETDDRPDPIVAPPAQAVEEQPVATYADGEADALVEALKRTMHRTPGAMRWWHWEDIARAAPNDDERERIYQRAIGALPDSYQLMCNYANFLRRTRKDYDKAEAHYVRALAANPDSAKILSNYALFLCDIRKDYDQSEAHYIRALAADPQHPNTLGNYSRFLLATGKIEQGLVMLARAMALAETEIPLQLAVELSMYAVCHRLPEHWRESLPALKKRLLQDKVTTGDWDFSGVIASAKTRGHPAAEWLEPLAAVCAGKADASTLEGWDDWKRA
jgi:tetratricopeptide (TPR) repeat protein